MPDSSVFEGLAQEATATSVLEKLAGTLLTADASPPLTCISANGVNLTANVAASVLSQNLGRVYATVQHIGTNGYVYVVCNATAADGIGEQLAPGQQWSCFTSDAVSVFASANGRVSTTEWAAG